MKRLAIISYCLLLLIPAQLEAQDWYGKSDSLFQASRYRAAIAMLTWVEPDEPDEEIAWHLELGRHLTYMADYEKAMCHLQEAERLVNNYCDESHPLLPEIYDRMGEWHQWKFFDSNTAICLSNKALVLRSRHHPNDSIGFAKTYYQLGRAYQELMIKRSTGNEADYQQIALAFFKKAKAVPGLREQDPDTYGWLLNRIPLCEHTILTRGRHINNRTNWEEKYRKLFSQLEVCAQFFKQHFEAPHFGISQNDQSFGNFYADKVSYDPDPTKRADKDRFATSSTYIQKALLAREELFGKNHPKVALMHHLLGHNAAVLKEHSTALSHFLKTNQLLLPDTPFDSIHQLPLSIPQEESSLNYLIYNLTSLNHEYRRMAEKEKSNKKKAFYLKAELKVLSLLVDATQQLQLQRSSIYLENRSDVFAVSRAFRAVDINRQLTLLNEEPDQASMINCLNLSSGNSLNDSYQRHQLFSLYGELLDIQSQIDSFRFVSTSNIPQDLESLLERSFSLSKEARIIHQVITEEIMSSPATSLEDLQQTLARDSAQILVVGYDRKLRGSDSGRMYTFFITPDTLGIGVDTVPYFPFDSLLLNMNTGDITSNDNYEQFCHWSKASYDLIFQGIREHLKQSKLVLITGENMGAIPFDLLISEIPDQQQGLYRDLPFLLKEFEISNSYSVGSYYQSVNRPAGNVSKMLSILPRFGVDSTISTREFSSLDLTRGKLVPLPGARREVAFAESELGATIISGADAQEKRFRELAPDFQLLHLATHGVANPVSPLESRIAFNQQIPLSPIDPNDGFLFAREIYGMNLNCELAILSACQTGEGRYSPGEGVLNFAHAFLFAGAKSVVTTHWPVPDSTSADIVIGFMQELKNGARKSTALSVAKRQYLAQADEIHAHPYFWAGYSLSGNDNPLRFPEDPEYALEIPTFWKWSLLLMGSILILLVIWRFKFHRAHN